MMDLGGGGVGLYGKYGDPRLQAQRANALAQAHYAASARGGAGSDPRGLADDRVGWHQGRPQDSGWYGSEWQHGRSPAETARLRDRFEQFVPKVASAAGPGRAQAFFNDILPPGAQLTPGSGAGYRGAMQNSADLRKRAGVGGGGMARGGMGIPNGGQSAGGGVMQQTQMPYQPEFASPDRQNYPIHRNLANIYWRLFYKLDAVVGNGIEMYCLPAGEQVLIPSGSANIEDLRPGDEVLAPSGGTQQIEAIGNRQFKGELIETRGSGLLPFRTTNDHPVFVVRGRKIRDLRSGGRGRWEPVEGAGDFASAGTLQLHDYLKVSKPATRRFDAFDMVDYLEPSAARTKAQLFSWDETAVWSRYAHTDLQRRVTRYVEADADLAELFGWYAAEGSRTRVNVTFSLNTAETAHAERITELAMKVFSLPRDAISWSRDEERHSLRVTICSAAVAGLFRFGGDGAENKVVPEFVLFGSNENRKRFLAAYFHGDGSRKSKSSVAASTISRALAVQVQLIGLALGIFINVGFQDREWRRDGDFPGAHDAYRMHAPKRLVYPEVYGEEAPALDKQQPQRAIECEDHWLVPIVKLGREEWDDLVYDVRVPEHAFCLPAVVHNSTLPFGNVEFTGEGVDGEIKDAMEQTWEVCKIRNLLPYFVSEYLVTGEACPHTFYDKRTGGWSYVGMHNPDQLEVVYTPFVKMDPIVRFKPDARLQQVLSTPSEQIQHVRESMPAELLSALTSGQAIELHPLNFTFLARKMHPYDIRGTSILSRMWRAFMFEDAVFNATIATARRHAGPIKVAKLGDRATGWIPDPSHEQRLLELLAQCEIDVNAWLVYHYGIEFDLVGTTDRVMTIDKHWDLIERIKLIALGISKAFLHGEVTYASAASGLTVFLQRLLALREYFENAWILPKFFKPLAVMNAWVKPTPAELSHGVRTRRSQRELLDDNRYIVPSLEWSKKLDPSVEQAQITAVQALSAMGVCFSKGYLASLAGKEWEEELKQRAAEAQIEAKLIKENPLLAQALQPPAEGGAGGGPGMMPGIPGGDMGFEDAPPAEGDLPPGGDPGAPMPPEGTAGIHGDAGESGAPAPGPAGGRNWNKPAIWRNERCGNWQAGVVSDLIDVFEGAPADEDLWDDLMHTSEEAKKAVRKQDAEAFWDAVEAFLSEMGYPSADIVTLEDILKLERILGGAPKAVARRRGRRRLEHSDFDDPQLLVGAPG